MKKKKSIQKMLIGKNTTLLKNMTMVKGGARIYVCTGIYVGGVYVETCEWVNLEDKVE